MNIYQEILATRSFTALTYKIEEALIDAANSDKEVLTRMLNANKLDEIYAIAHDQLGEHEEAAKLRQWLQGREYSRNQDIDAL